MRIGKKRKKEVEQVISLFNLFFIRRNPPMPSGFRASNPLSQVGVRRRVFEVPFRGHVSHTSI